MNKETLTTNEEKRENVTTKEEQVIAIDGEDYVKEDGSYEKAPKTLSSLVALGAVIVSPTDAFKSLRRDPKVLLAIFLIPLLPVLYYVLCWDSYQFILMEQINSSSAVPIEPEIMEIMMKGMQISTPIITYVSFPVTIVIAAAIYFAVGKIFKAELSFKQTYSATLYSALISNLIWVFHLVVTLVFGQSNIMASMSSLASLLPAETIGSPLSVLASTVDVFSIWYFFVLYLALHLTCNYSKKLSAVTVILTYLVSTGLSVGTVAMATMVQGV